MLTQTAEYALRAVLHLAAASEGEQVQGETIARALGVPRNYLSKVLHALAREGILSSVRGPHGGFALARDPQELTLAEVLAPFDPVEDRCLLIRRKCSDANPCLAHHQWKEVALQIRTFFRGTTIADLIRDAAEAGRADAPFLPNSEQRPASAPQPWLAPPK